MSSYDVILHPTDFSAESEQAFQLACNLARDQFASLVVVHALPSEYESANSQDLKRTQLLADCQNQFAQMRRRAPDVPISFLLVFGHAVMAILKAAMESDAELIVIASHRHEQFHLQLHGSIAEGVLRQAHCPVLVLRQPVGSLRRVRANPYITHER